MHLKVQHGVAPSRQVGGFFGIEIGVVAVVIKCIRYIERNWGNLHKPLVKHVRHLVSRHQRGCRDKFGQRRVVRFRHMLDISTPAKTRVGFYDGATAARRRLVR